MKLTPLRAYHYHGIAQYIITHDRASGCRRRYTVLLRTLDDPVVIGRELDLRTVRNIVREYEAVLATMPRVRHGLTRRTALKPAWTKWGLDRCLQVRADWARAMRIHKRLATAL